MSEDTTDPSYWLNWRFLVCGLFILFDVLLAIFLVWRYEGGKRGSAERRDHPTEGVGIVYEDEAWKTCLKGVHPAWLLGFRLSAFVLLLTLIVGNSCTDGAAIFFYYTQLTFSLVTLYFGFASAFSIYGCWQYHNSDFRKMDSRHVDMERGIYAPPRLLEYEGLPTMEKSLESPEVHCVRKAAGFWSYSFQIMYQICAGAVVLTDVIFWLVIFPFLTAIDYKLTFYVISMHSVNVVLLGDTMLNCMRFPMFRFGYFILWTGTYVIFQWIIHACVSFWWPYPFLDLSSDYAPLWYVGVGLLHIPCYGVFALLIRLKHFWMSRCFPGSYQGMK